MNWIELLEIKLERHKVANSNLSTRLYHGRGGAEVGPKHLAVEWHPDVLSFIFYREYEEEPEWIDFICSAFPFQQNIRIQRRYRSEAENLNLRGRVDSVVGMADGLTFALDMRQRQNPGYFLDMREVHRWVRDHAKNKQVLNLFSYTCLFSVYAVAGGAASVLNMDMSKSAIKTGKLNHKINALDTTDVKFFAHDVFASWSKVRKYGPYDLIIIDPPSFQKGSFVASKDYVRVLRQLPKFASDGADILLCLNSPEVSKAEFLSSIKAELPNLEFLQWLAVSDEFKEDSDDTALKVARFRF